MYDFCCFIEVKLPRVEHGANHVNRCSKEISNHIIFRSTGSFSCHIKLPSFKSFKSLFVCLRFKKRAVASVYAFLPPPLPPLNLTRQELEMKAKGCSALLCSARSPHFLRNAEKPLKPSWSKTFLWAAKTTHLKKKKQSKRHHNRKVSFRCRVMQTCSSKVLTMMAR